MIQTAKWIWYPDDFEIELSNKFMSKRYERDVFIPPFWKQYSVNQNVKFIKRFTLTRQEKIKFEVEGDFNILLNGNYVYDFNGVLSLDVGEYEIVVSVYNACGIPCMKCGGETVFSNEEWKVTRNDHVEVFAACDSCLLDNGSTPNRISLPVEKSNFTIIHDKSKNIYDAGKEVFAYIKIYNLNTKQNACIYFGETLEEVKDTLHCELTYKLDEICAKSYITKIAKAFRYFYIENATYDSLEVYFEYLPMEKKCSFKCNDEEINRIYQTSLYTLSLNSREFLIDGIKRDRWLWSGDAYQGYLMQFYTFNNAEIMKRTMIALFGKSPFDQHLNHILDYSFYWIMGLHDYLAYTGDEIFVKKNAYKAFEIIDYCIGRTNNQGMVEGKKEDWVFVDWADIDNSGVVCFEQMLFYISLKYSAQFAKFVDNDELKNKYEMLAEKAKNSLESFYDLEKGGYVHNIKNGKKSEKITRYANIFAILYGIIDDDRKNEIKNKVLLNKDVQAITTPYMRFYELSAMLEIGEYDYVLKEIKDYWGGMLKLGATSFWEMYDSSLSDDEQYAMYGRKYGKSLAHAWGASPTYLMGKYFIGLRPNGDKFVLSPHLSKLKWFEATLPYRNGTVYIKLTADFAIVKSEGVSGTLNIGGKQTQLNQGETYEIRL